MTKILKTGMWEIIGMLYFDTTVKVELESEWFSLKGPTNIIGSNCLRTSGLNKS